ncbi:tumor necrosis factor ligand superfamily member 8 [Rana temporaria]|uniref:tumor necrosis factor ligand superfamily member 8 n=1 Tax=Rana temporaria TaxID=8407 RepID=UPI001AADC17D|nr:tumor necrosis factor ligand superfamily member 8 [Rana temporaria]
MMEPQDLATRELRAIKKTLCYISSTACALCLVCTATTLVLLLSDRMVSVLLSQLINPTKNQLKPSIKHKDKFNFFNFLRSLVLPGTSSTLLWKNDRSSKGMKYQDGKLTILTKGLYFVNCQLQFVVRECLEKNEDLRTNLVLNGKEEHLTMQTLPRQNNTKPNETNPCKMFTNQHFSLQIKLNVDDNISVHTSHPHWLSDDGLSVDSSVFGAFKISDDF